MLRTALALSLSVIGATATFNFVSIGDWGCVPIGGWHEQDELIVAQSFMNSATQVNARFVLNTGDNFYYCGVEPGNTTMWQQTFENVYNESSVMVPWYGCLGNHDYGYPGSAEAQIQYQSPNNNRWVIPDRYYYKRLEFPGEVNISLVVMDASPCQSEYVSSDPSGWDPCGSVIPGCPGCTFHQNVVKQSCATQLQWLNSILPTIPNDDWKIAMIHAPASDIDVEDLITPLQNANFNLLLNGHVHLMAHYQMDNAGTYVTTGGGCMVRVPQDQKKKAADVEAQGNRAPPMLRATSCSKYSKFHSCQIVWQQTIAGYTTHSFDASFQTLTTYIYDWGGNLLHTAVAQKNGDGPQPPSPPSPPGPPSPPSPPNSHCCHYSDSSCNPGQICCNDEDKSYQQHACQGYEGQAHNCVWTGSECVVGGGSSSGGQ